MEGPYESNFAYVLQIEYTIILPGEEKFTQIQDHDYTGFHWKSESVFISLRKRYSQRTGSNG